MLGLGLMAGAVLHAPLRAQDTTKVRDTVKVRGDTTIVKAHDTTLVTPAHVDSTADTTKTRIKRDTIKAPIAHAELPVDISIERRVHWSRDSLFATGAITLADLLGKVTGVTTMSAGWIAAPSVASYMGDIRRVRVFLDGFEYTGMDPRGQGVLDLTQINLWSLEDLSIEQTADEIRVYMRSWRVRNTTPETRTDIGTGDQQTNLYRGFFGKRYDNGLDLQFAAQQYGTSPPSFFGQSSDQTGVVGRIGWAKGAWSADLFENRIQRHRGQIYADTTTGSFLTDSIFAAPSTRTDTYLRLGYADPDTSHMWAQVMAEGSKYKYTGVRTLHPASVRTIADSLLASLPLDTNVYRSQYVATVGSTRGPLRVSATERFFAEGGQSISAPSARASYELPRVAVTAFYDAQGVDSIGHRDVTAQFRPLSFISILGSVGQISDDRIRDSSFTAKYLRAELGLRLRDLWFIGGILRRDSVRLSPPNIFDTNLVAVREPAATGMTAAIRGRLWRAVHADIQAVRWNDTTTGGGFYRPRYETRSELYIRTNWLQRFPSGNFGLNAGVVHEYRSGTNFPDAVLGTVPTVGYRTISTLLEIRVLTATISWQFRNTLGERYAQVPGFIAPRQTNFYGVRWSFFN